VADFEHFAIRHSDGRFFYHITLNSARLYENVTVCADDQLLTRLGAFSNWWVSDHEAEVITVTYHFGPEIVGWRLKDPADASAKFPPELTPDQHDNLEETYGSQAAYRLYESVTALREPLSENVPGPWRVLDGEVPDETRPGRAWVASLPQVLISHPQYHRYFPGHIPGLYAEVQDRIKRMRHVAYVLGPTDRDPFQGMKVVVEVPFETPHTEVRHEYDAQGRRLKRTHQAPKLARRELILPVPHRVRGDNYAEALAEYDSQLAFWLSVAESAGVKACDACDGTGHVPNGSEQYEVPRP